MRSTKLVVAACFGLLGLLVIVSSIYVTATGRESGVTIWVALFTDRGLVPGLMLLCTGVILVFMPREKS